tara:strand:+ start:502 stop:777 length:276 start_codon:yes stop_codon:yes gene_type:complete
VGVFIKLIIKCKQKKTTYFNMYPIKYLKALYLDLKELKMFGLFKRKSQKEKLLDLYRKKKELAFKVSKTNRKESDKLEKEAADILVEIDKI